MDKIIFIIVWIIVSIYALRLQWRLYVKKEQVFDPKNVSYSKHRGMTHKHAEGQFRKNASFWITLVNIIYLCAFLGLDSLLTFVIVGICVILCGGALWQGIKSILKK